jgi:hypothetical protein
MIRGPVDRGQAGGAVNWNVPAQLRSDPEREEPVDSRESEQDLRRLDHLIEGSGFGSAVLKIQTEQRCGRTIESKGLCAALSLLRIWYRVRFISRQCLRWFVDKAWSHILDRALVHTGVRTSSYFS